MLGFAQTLGKQNGTLGVREEKMKKWAEDLKISYLSYLSILRTAIRMAKLSCSNALLQNVLGILEITRRSNQ